VAEEVEVDEAAGCFVDYPTAIWRERLHRVGRLATVRARLERREVVAGQLVQSTIDFAEAELTFENAERTLGDRVVAPAVPGAMRLGVDAVGDNVEVSVGAIAMRDGECLVFGEPELVEDPLRDLAHRGRIREIRGVEGEDQVVDGKLDAVVLRRGGAHQRGSVFGIVEREIPTLGPCDALVLLA
jgi:hypothetical protein